MAVRAASPVELDRIGDTTLFVAETDVPWDLDADAIVLSVAADGYGILGSAFRSARPDIALPDAEEIASSVGPGSPLIVPADGDGSQSASVADPLRFVVLASVRPGPRPIAGYPPVDPQLAVLASMAALGSAWQVGARRVALPLLGTGYGGLTPAQVIAPLLAALRAAAAGATQRVPGEVVLFSQLPAAVQTIRETWQQHMQGVQLTMLADLPIDDPHFDILGTNAYAEALAFVVDHRDTSTPLTIAINAPWGAGKTSVARLTERRLRTFLLRSREPIVCWFNAWHHDDAPHIASALASATARAAAAERTLWRRVLDPLPTRMLTPDGRRRRWLLTTVLSLGVGLAVLIGTGAAHDLTTGKVTFSVVLTLLTAGAREVSTVRGTASAVGSLVRTPETALASGSLDEVRSDLGRLIHQATRRGSRRLRQQDHRRFIVFIDDLERCQPDRSIEVCETVSTLLSHEDVVVFLIGDMQTLATAAESKYKDLAPRYRTATLTSATGEATASSFGELYLEKIVQFRFDLPTHDLPALTALAHALEQQHGTAGRDADVSSRTSWTARRYRDWRWRRRLRRQSWPALAQPVQESPGAAIDEYEEQLAALRSLLERVEGPSLQESFDAVAALVRPLPRDLKRLLNRIRFYLYLLDRRGILAPAGAVSPQAVGKWALLAERWPDLTAAVSSEPALLGELEVQSKTIPGFIAAMGAQVPGYSRSAELQRLLVAPPELGPLAPCLSRLIKG